ncbi:MAG: hypothetical protein LC643_00590 [Bacteroidales bacterium]|nr:hypothetical protein [Bacteroidales bacterium]
MKQKSINFQTQLLIFLLIVGTIWGSCQIRPSDYSVHIQQGTDTIPLGSYLSAELYLKHKNKAIPADYYILYIKDTFLLEYDHEKKCAYFNAEPSSVGDKKYNGFVVYEEEGTKKSQMDFTINFHVRR